MTWEKIKDEIDKQLDQRGISENTEVDYVELVEQMLGDYEIEVCYDGEHISIFKTHD